LALNVGVEEYDVYSSNETRRRYIRLRNYDYSQPGFYFITICTRERKWMLGDIVNGEMCLNIAGSIAQSLWSALPERFPHVELDQYIIMPNRNCSGGELHALLKFRKVAE
jgi:putative transposase